MIGVIVISHGRLAEGILSAVNMIAPGQEQIASLSVEPDTDPDDFEEQLRLAVAELNTGDGVVILADLLGGTPCNRALSLLENPEIQILTGVNLPMILAVLTLRNSYSKVSTLIKEVSTETHNGINNLRDLLKENEND